MKKISLWSKLPEELDNLLLKNGYKKYRSQQIVDWLYSKDVYSFADMTNIGKADRAKLDDIFDLSLPEIETEEISVDETRKYLLKLEDEQYIEMVLIPADEKLTLCISSQVGCKRGCEFCATSALGYVRNLTVSEIMGQIILARKLAGTQKLTNIVFMGMGEPLDNLNNVVKTVKIMQDERGFNFSPRRVTISSCGIVPELIKLADMEMKMKLAISLNSAIDAKRRILMPVNGRYPLSHLKPALIYFSKKSPHRVTFEYVMIRNFNMEAEDIKALRSFTGDMSCKINLIPWNPVPGSKYQAPSTAEINAFQKELFSTADISVTLRNSKGQDINAACGMLAGKKKEIIKDR